MSWWLRDESRLAPLAFYDDSYTFDLKRAFAICDEMQEAQLDLPWDCRTRVDASLKSCWHSLRNKLSAYPLWR
jgi:hypothetical protein